MTACKYWDAGWCYAPDDVETSASSQSACFDPDYCPYLKSQMTEKEQIEGEIKILQKKLALLEEMEKYKSPAEEAYKDWMGQYPPTGSSVDAIDLFRWRAFQKGYNAAQEDYKVGEYQEEPEEKEWKNVALEFGKKLPVILPHNYDELSPASWFRWVVFTYDKYMEQRDKESGYTPKLQERGELHKDVERVVKESVKWCEEHPDWDLFYYLNPQTEKEVKKLQEKEWNVDVKTNLKPHWEPKPQEPEEVAEGLSTAFREAVKQGVVSSVDKPKDDFDDMMDDLIEKFKKDPPPFLRFELGKTLEQLIERWWCDVFTSKKYDWDMETAIDDLVDRVELWMPREGSTAGSQDTYACIAVDAENDLLKKIKSKLRNKKDT